MAVGNKPAQGRVKRTVGFICLGLLCLAVVLLGMRTAHFAALTREEAATTPTPVPVAGNMLAVTPDPNAPTPEPLLKNGVQGEAVSALQARLAELGYYTGEIDGQFGPGTRNAVQWFQEQHGLSADGVVGSETRMLLDSAQAQPAPTPTLEPLPTAAASLPYEPDGMPLLVNREHPLPEGYACVELVNLTEYCDAQVVKIKGNGIEGERVAVDALMTMLRAAQAEGVSPWQISAGWRSVGYQEQLLQDKIYSYRKEGMSSARARAAALRTVAEPGASEHHTGLAFDITVPGVSFQGTEQARWLQENCWDYGFILRYTAEKEEMTGFAAEAWHFRYVGQPHARIMGEENLCLEEYLASYGPTA